MGRGTLIFVENCKNLEKLQKPRKTAKSRNPGKPRFSGNPGNPGIRPPGPGPGPGIWKSGAPLPLRINYGSNTVLEIYIVYLYMEIPKNDENDQNHPILEAKCGRGPSRGPSRIGELLNTVGNVHFRPPQRIPRNRRFPDPPNS